MQIGIVAKKIGLSVDAIRFYERNALLPRAARTEGGFRQYGESDVETLTFIRRVQGLGFKLREIRGLLSLRGSRLQPCAPVRRRLEEKLVDVQRKLADLQKLEHELRVALRSCNRELRNQPAHSRGEYLASSACIGFLSMLCLPPRSCSQWRSAAVPTGLGIARCTALSLGHYS